MPRVVDFRVEGVGFYSWLGHCDFTLGQDILRIVIPLHAAVYSACHVVYFTVMSVSVEYTCLAYQPP